MKLNEMLAYKVAMLSNDLSQSLASIYRPFGLSMPEWRVVATLGNNNAMLSKNIAVATRLDKVQISRALQQLENKQLVIRMASERDKRAVNVALSEKGKNIFNEITPLVSQWQAEKIKNITADEYNTFLKVMNSLSDE